MNTLASNDLRILRDSSALVTVHAIDNLIGILAQTRDYLGLDDREAVTGALLEIEEQVEDIRAALRIKRIALPRFDEIKGGR